MKIKPGNLLKDEELKTLRGGQQVLCAVYYDDHYQGVWDFLCWDSQSECDASCASAFQNHTNPSCFCNYGY